MSCAVDDNGVDVCVDDSGIDHNGIWMLQMWMAVYLVQYIVLGLYMLYRDENTQCKNKNENQHLCSI